MSPEPRAASTTSDDPAVALRAAQVVVGALAFGVLTFAAIAASMAPLADSPAPPIALGLDALGLAAVAVTLTAAPFAFILPTRIVENARSGSKQQRLAAFRASRILGGALCEGPALFWCVAMLLHGNRWYLVPVAILLALMMLQFPTRDTFEAATGTRLG